MTTVLSRMDVDSITRQARQVKFTTALLRLFAALIFGWAWLLAKLLGVLWLAAAWVFVCFREGWNEGVKGTSLERVKLPARA